MGDAFYNRYITLHKIKVLCETEEKLKLASANFLLYVSYLIKISKIPLKPYFIAFFRQQVICLKNKNALKSILVRRFFTTF